MYIFLNYTFIIVVHEDISSLSFTFPSHYEAKSTYMCNNRNMAEGFSKCYEAKLIINNKWLFLYIKCLLHEENIYLRKMRDTGFLISRRKAQPHLRVEFVGP